ncbi:hypothetical protein CA236_09580 [Sphingomonas sp. ABOLG]|jgi:hypothetical protein|uniref:Uncharacterized protein n=1 Tax=Sphingomonas olei TaxID=1886787 RepID=A0ABY2QJE7_9SPHN|nr:MULTISPECIES: hypothetical protein [Sphingomonas]RSV18322.1 hypothetical protein CA236_09580 [Sphingomonas sp. ABOLG]THG41030.1 hypothetical protein E5988_05500 [Sphingomonas olei]
MLTLLLTLLVAAPGQVPDKPSKREVAERSADPANKMICKRFQRIGSLVGTNRVCKTKRDWDVEREALNQWSPAISCRPSDVTGRC